MADNAAAFADQATITDRNDGVGDHLLPRHHPRRQSDLRPEQRAVPYLDVLLVEERVWRKANHTVCAELAESFATPGIRADGAKLAYRVPAEVNEISCRPLGARECALT